MARRIVLFGATGHTGRLVAEALVASGCEPLLAGRRRGAVAALAARLGGLEHAVADARDPRSVASLLDSDSVLVTTVGPFGRWGHGAVQAAVERGATYLDSTGEPAFIRAVFERYGPAARRSGASLLPAMGFDYVPGALAGTLALTAAGSAATRVEIGYFVLGGANASAGTRRSAAAASLQESFAFRDGRLRTVRIADRARRMRVAGTVRSAVSVGGAEHYALPAVHPDLREVAVYAGFSGRGVPAVRVAALLLAGAGGVPHLSDALGAGLDRLASRGAGPDESPGGESVIVARAYDEADRRLASIELRGSEPYALTARILAWAAAACAAGERAPGVLGPVEAFGASALERGCAGAGLRRVSAEA